MNEQFIVRENPAFPSTIVGQVAVASTDDVDAAVVAANDAQHVWERMPLDERRHRLLAAVRALTAADRDHIASTLCMELGKPMAASRSELAAALRLIDSLIEIAPQCLLPDETLDHRGRLLVNKVPWGVVAGFLPWNAPLFVAALKLTPALLAGNALVLKSSPLAPLAIGLLIDHLRLHLPAGVLQLLHGHALTGQALVRHRLIRKLSFTGSANTARVIQATSAHLIRPSLMELGGNDAALILDDAVLTEADYEQLVHACFHTSGQTCIGCKRIYVPRARMDAFVGHFCRTSNRLLRIGDPQRPDVSVGPVVSVASKLRLEELLASLHMVPGVSVINVGQVVPEDAGSSGYYVQPSVVVGLPPSSPLVCEEQFGPIVPILAYDALDDVIADVNATDYGLGGSVWSSDLTLAFEIASRFRSGLVSINSHGRLSLMPHAPFGGMKDSGYGRESGVAGLLEYIQYQSVFLPSTATG